MVTQNPDLQGLEMDNFSKAARQLHKINGELQDSVMSIRMLRPPLPGIVVVQHIPPVFSRLFAERLNAESKFKVMEAAQGMPVQPGEVYIAPGDKHGITDADE